MSALRDAKRRRLKLRRAELAARAKAKATDRYFVQRIRSIPKWVWQQLGYML
jgi:hypothetical protein